MTESSLGRQSDLLDCRCRTKTRACQLHRPAKMRKQPVNRPPLLRDINNWTFPIEQLSIVSGPLSPKRHDCKKVRTEWADVMLAIVLDGREVGDTTERVFYLKGEDAFCNRKPISGRSFFIQKKAHIFTSQEIFFDTAKHRRCGRMSATDCRERPIHSRQIVFAKRKKQTKRPSWVPQVSKSSQCRRSGDSHWRRPAVKQSFFY